MATSALLAGAASLEKQLPRILLNSEIDGALSSLSRSFCLDIRILDLASRVLTRWAGEADCSESNKVAQSEIRIVGNRVGYVAISAGTHVGYEALQSLANLIAITLGERFYTEYELASISNELSEKYEEINLLYQISESLGAVFEPKRVCEIALEQAIRALHVRRASIMVYDDKEGDLKILAARGLPEKVIDSTTVKPGEGVSGWVFERGEPLLVEDLNECEFIPPRASNEGNYDTDSFLSVPMLCSPVHVKGRKLGVINLTDKEDSQPFTSEDLKLLTTIASVTAISLYNSLLIQEVRAAERLQRDLEIANSIQLSLLPQRSPKIHGGELASVYRLAKNVGGDYYDFYLAGDDLLSLVIADVAGHNIGAALMMVEARSVIRSEMALMHDPAVMLHGTNSIIHDDLERGELFVSAFCARLDQKTWNLEYANAGHCLPFWVEGATGKVHRLDADGMLLGIWPEVAFERRSISLEATDLVFLFTDGVSEAKNAEGQQFGEERLAQVIVRNRFEAAEQILSLVEGELLKFTGNAEIADDITMVVLRRTDSEGDVGDGEDSAH